MKKEGKEHEREQKELHTAFYEDEGVGRGVRERGYRGGEWVEGMGKGIGKARE
jgi:hypothetical protein